MASRLRPAAIKEVTCWSRHRDVLARAAMFPSRIRPGRPTQICAGDEVECIDDQLPPEPYELIADPDIRIINQPILYRYPWTPK
jgi:hypothetical protein